MINGWTYYNHAVIPTVAPHEVPNLEPIKNGTVWSLGKQSLLATWTTDFDCGYKTEWWYVIKDEPFDINLLKSKHRYVINRGKKYFFVKCINPLDYSDELYDVQVAAFSAYPKKYRPNVDKQEFINVLKEWQDNNNIKIYGAYFKENEALCGYIMVKIQSKCIELKIQKANPHYEKYQINAALVNALLTAYEEKLKQGYYILDGARSINHETAFQDYLEKYFRFRKAYCKLNIKYRGIMRFIVGFLYPCRGLLLKLDNIGIIHSVNALLKMEQCRRSFIN